MTDVFKYSLQEFNHILFQGFDFKLDDPTIQLISELALEVGSPTYIKTPIFTKKEQVSKPAMSMDNKRKKIKAHEIVNDEDWETLRTFHATKIEQKVGIDAEIDVIRSHLNKISDKNYEDLKSKIVSVIDGLIENNISDENMLLVSNAIFEIASTNRFYSKLYADLYTLLIKNYEMMKQVFETNFDTFLDVFKQIEYVDPDKDYDKFCRINKNNEKRKALSAFFVNLTINGILSIKKLIFMICYLLRKVNNMIVEDNKKNEVDEITENIAILCGNKALIESDNTEVDNGLTILETIVNLAHSKTKTYPSLSKKSIFKYMDMIDM